MSLSKNLTRALIGLTITSFFLGAQFLLAACNSENMIIFNGGDVDSDVFDMDPEHQDTADLDESVQSDGDLDKEETENDMDSDEPERELDLPETGEVEEISEIEEEDEFWWVDDPNSSCPDLSGCFSITMSTLGGYYDGQGIAVEQRSCTIEIYCDSSYAGVRLGHHLYKISPDGAILMEKDVEFGLDVPYYLHSSGVCWISQAPFTDYFVTVCKDEDFCGGMCMVY
jgi:hypothetical protein